MVSSTTRVGRRVVFHGLRKSHALVEARRIQGNHREAFVVVMVLLGRVCVCVCSGEEKHVTRDRESPLWEENKKSREGGVTLFDTEFVRNGSIAYASVTI
jgi:hypothetical protein